MEPRGSDIAAALDEAVDLLVRGEAIVEDGGYLKPKPSGVVPSGLPRAGSERGESVTSPKPAVKGYAEDKRFFPASRARRTSPRANDLPRASSQLESRGGGAGRGDGAGRHPVRRRIGGGGTVTVDRERDLALFAQELAAVEEIDHTLLKLDNGTYGICENCGHVIVKPRLEALPYARLCIDCKSGGLSIR